MPMNRRWLLASRPDGLPEPGNFRLDEATIPEPAHGQILTRGLWHSVDPYMRGRMGLRKSYAPAIGIGAVMTGESVGRVIASRHPGFAEGDIVLGNTGWQEYALLDGPLATKVDPLPWRRSRPRSACSACRG